MSSPVHTSPSTSSAQQGRAQKPSASRITDNLVMINQRRAPLSDLYHRLLTMSWLGFVGIVLSGYLVANLTFAALYFSIPNAISNANDYWDCFFFSVQTWATIGYGGMTPLSRLANVIVVIESLVGIFAVALLTGLFFAKFSRTTARVLFASRAVISTRNGKKVLMVRAGNERGSFIVEATAHLTLLKYETTAEGERMRRMHELSLVRGSSPFFVLSWTLMHEIGPDSPLHGVDATAFAAEDMRLTVSLVGYDSSVGQTIHSSNLYEPDEVLFDHRYRDATYIDDQGRTVLDYGKFHDVEPIVLVA